MNDYTAHLVFIIVFIMLVMVFINRNKIFRHKADNNFNNLHGDTWDDNAENAVWYYQHIKHPTALDHFRQGTILLVNAKDHHAASQRFRTALEEIIDNENDENTAYIIDRIIDYNEEFEDFPEIEELPIQQAVLAYYNQKIDDSADVKKQLIDKKIKPQKYILSKKHFTSDSQNVHDSIINDSLKSQFLYIRHENAQEPELQQYTFNTLVEWVNNRPEHEQIRKVLDRIGGQTSFMSTVSEREFILEIWKRINSQQNTHNHISLLDAFATALVDCIEGDVVVCMSGRNSKMLQSLAKLDINEKLGILKNKQMLRNEIYEQSAKILNDCLNDTSEEVQQAYYAGEESAQIDELRERIIENINNLRKYYTHVPKYMLDDILNECISVV